LLAASQRLKDGVKVAMLENAAGTPRLGWWRPGRHDVITRSGWLRRHGIARIRNNELARTGGTADDRSGLPSRDAKELITINAAESYRHVAPLKRAASIFQRKPVGFNSFLDGVVRQVRIDA
jgi:hypothetical protein